MTDNSIRDLTNRLNRLERTNQNMRRGLFASGAVGSSYSQSVPRCPTRQMIARTSRLAQSGEPTLKMFDHEERLQIFLGIDEFWEDTAYLSVSSRLVNGNIDKQAVIAATASRPESPSSSQLVLYDGHPKQDDAVRRYVTRGSSGLAE